MFKRRLPLPPPRTLPWPLKPLSSAQTTLSYDDHGRMVMTIEHDIIKGVTPQMLAWWFGNIGGEMEVEGQQLNKYLVWHPCDHIRWELVRPGWDGRASAGAQFRIVEAFGRNPAHYIDVIDHVIRLDTTGFTAKSGLLGLEGSRLNHDFRAVSGGARYSSMLTIGVAVPGIGKLVNAAVHRIMFTEAMGRAWLKHNVEEVGLLEHFLPSLYTSMARIEAAARSPGFAA